MLDRASACLAIAWVAGPFAFRPAASTAAGFAKTPSFVGPVFFVPSPPRGRRRSRL